MGKINACVCAAEEFYVGIEQAHRGWSSGHHPLRLPIAKWEIRNCFGDLQRRTEIGSIGVGDRGVTEGVTPKMVEMTMSGAGDTVKD
eukprot:scaffold9747_cov125-Skeletonema_dohrnii-CCMP3373.AAC.6